MQNKLGIHAEISTQVLPRDLRWYFDSCSIATSIERMATEIKWSAKI